MNKITITRIDNGFVMVNNDDGEEQTFAFVTDEHEANDYDPALKELLQCLCYEMYGDLYGNKWGEKTLVIGVEPGKNYEKPE